MVKMLGISAYSGTGKTTLLKQLIPILKKNGVRIALIKHTHHDMEIDTPGKDSYELRKAGADQTIVASDNRWALMTETPENRALELHTLANKFDHTKLDLILVEGFKHEPIPKIVLYRFESGRPYAELIDQHTIAIASDLPIEQVSCPQLSLNAPNQIAKFIQQWMAEPK